MRFPILKDLMSKDVVVDANVLLEFLKVFLEDNYSKHVIQGKRNKEFLLIEFFKDKNIYIVPQVLAEIYSLLKRDSKKDKKKLSFWLERLIPHFINFSEEFIPKEKIIQENKFADFGFTDIALSKIIKDRLLVTADAGLFYYCRNKGLKVKHLEEILTLI